MIAVLTTLAMLAFAANSLLARAALAGGGIDPASFTAIRLLAGAAMLAALLITTRGRRMLRTRPGSLGSAICLLVYGFGFSLAYVRLATATGALILFAAVQASMMALAAWQGHQPKRLEIAGLLVALAGFIWLMLPGLRAPDPIGALLMAASGAAWGLYSIRGRGGQDPVGDSAGNFLRASLIGFVLAASAGFLQAPVLGGPGVALAMVSGAVTSGLGYVIWYRVLPRLAPIAAASMQLTVPVIAALGGVLLLGEALTLRLVLAGAVILAGVAITAVSRTRAA